MKSTNTTVTIADKNKDKRLARKKKTAEDFTPSWLVNQMLDKLEEYSPTALIDFTKTFLDPACGNGNMLVEVLKAKINKGSTPIQALNAIYGCDIMPDNIKECQLRLFKVITQFANEGYIKLKGIELLKTLARNIVFTPLTKYPNGSLDYLSLPEDKTFNREISDEQAKKTLDKIIAEKLLETVTV